MNTEELRAREIANEDRTLDAPWLVRQFIGVEGRKLARVNRRYWQEMGPAELEKLLALYEKEPYQAEAALTLYAHYRRNGDKLVYCLIGTAVNDVTAVPMVLLSVVWDPASGQGGETLCLRRAHFLRDFTEVPAYLQKDITPEASLPEEGVLGVKRQGVVEASPVCTKWRKGPLPPDTWNWGGVTLVGEDPNSGFYFADFCGDHVKMELIEKDKDGNCVRSWKRIEASEVQEYCNCLTIPSLNREKTGVAES
jgi:hypothetical protein